MGVPVRAKMLGKLSAVLMLLGLASLTVGLCNGGISDGVGALLPALSTTPRMANPVPRSYLEAVGMSTHFTDPYVKAMKKKNPKTGATKNLMGYTVGSRAPATAVKSGTTIFQVTGKTSYGKNETQLGMSGGESAGKANAVNLGLGL